MAASHKRARVKNVGIWRFVLISSLGFLFLLLLLRENSFLRLANRYAVEGEDAGFLEKNSSLVTQNLKLPEKNELATSLDRRNRLPPKNLDLYPRLPKNNMVIVLYVHNRPRYLKVVVDSLSQVKKIEETLLIVSHDGFYEEMNKIVDSIKFCRVKQIFAPYSPHLYPDSFPGVSENDCRDKEEPSVKGCHGTPDQYGNHRAPNIVSLKHHWWWMMNTVWDGLEETRHHFGHILFIEEDHFIYPNAYHNLKVLIELKPQKCPQCYAVNLAPSDVKSRGEGWDSLIAERMGNVGYSFNRTVWRKIHSKAKDFCSFDEYNWDITMWSTVFPSFGDPVYSLRGSRTSALHFGRCGLHQGQDKKSEPCIDEGEFHLEVDNIDKVSNIKKNGECMYSSINPVTKRGFEGGEDGEIQEIANYVWISAICMLLRHNQTPCHFFSDCHAAFRKQNFDCTMILLLCIIRYYIPYIIKDCTFNIL